MAKQWGISREEQNVFAVNSQNKIGVAQKKGYFQNEITPVTVTDRRGM